MCAPTNIPLTLDDKVQRSYMAGASMARSRMAEEAPLDAEALAAVKASDIVVVPGQYDHVEQVLVALDVPFKTVHPGALDRVGLRPEQLLVVNCPGELSAPEIVKIRDFVTAGGTLFTTDWALRHVIEPAFPGYIEYNNNDTRDDVVRIDIIDSDSPYLQGVLDSDDDPQWWLEGASYPIRILNTDTVRVLIRSKELGEKYGEEPVAVVFPFGKGEVFHMISHYYLQRAELRTARHQMSGESYFASKNVPVDDAMAYQLADLNLGDVEAAATSSRLFANIVADKKRRTMGT